MARFVGCLVFLVIYHCIVCDIIEVYSPMKMSGRDFMYGSFLTRVNGSVLVRNGTLLEQITVRNDVECVMKCIRHPSCLSVNYNDNKLCELLNWGATGYHRLLVPKKNAVHIRQEVCMTSILFF